jgi:hypothetical protein
MAIHTYVNPRDLERYVKLVLPTIEGHARSGDYRAATREVVYGLVHELGLRIDPDTQH